MMSEVYRKDIQKKIAQQYPKNSRYSFLSADYLHILYCP